MQLDGLARVETCLLALIAYIILDGVPDVGFLIRYFFEENDIDGKDNVRYSADLCKFSRLAEIRPVRKHTFSKREHKQ